MARTFNKRVVMTMVIIAHVIILMLFSIFALTAPAAAFTQVSYMKPVQFGYDLLGLDWVGYGRDAAHAIVTLCAIIIGTMLTKYGASLKNEVSQFFITMIGIQVMFGGFLNMTLLGLVFAGGFWHFLSLMVVGCEAASVAVTTFVMVLYWRSFVELGSRQDALVPKEQA